MNAACNMCDMDLSSYSIINTVGEVDGVGPFYVCKRPSCPNYGLLQVPEEEMKDG